MKITNIEATTIPDAWFQCIYKLLDEGNSYIVQKGSYEGESRLEFDFITVLIKHPYSEPYDSMLPDIPQELGIPNPVAPGYVEQYLPYLMTGTISSNEQYTYGSRIYDQISYWIDELKKTPKTNQAVLQVASPGDYKLSDPPCLREIGLKIKDGTLIFYPVFRSWDLWNGFPANLSAIAVLQNYMASYIGVESGPICAVSKGLHIYGYVEELAKLRCRRS
jgi:thymidylate synthase